MDHIHVTVAAIIRRNDKYLLVKETASSGQIVFNQPAGHVELKESLVDAVIREVHEEAGLDFEPTALVGTYLISPAVNGKTYLRFCFVGNTPVDQEASPNDPDIIDNCWLSLEEILALPKESIRSALVLKCIEDFQNGIRLPLESLNFTGDELGMYYDCHDKLQ